MPLLQGKKAATPQGKSQNISTLMHDIGHSPHVQSRDQAIAIAMNTARRARKERDDGGEATATIPQSLDQYGPGGPDASPSFNDRWSNVPSQSAPSPLPFQQFEGPSLKPPPFTMPHSGYGPIPTGSDAKVSPIPNFSPPAPEAKPMPSFGSGQYPLQHLDISNANARGGSPGGGQVELGGFPGHGAREAAFQGPLGGAGPGRTDRHQVNVKSGSYVVPADVVSILGEGNTLAGTAILHMLFPHVEIHGSAPHPPAGVKMGAAPSGPKPSMKASGGEARNGKDVPIIAADGEVVLSPEQIQGKFGDMNVGHEALDEFVKEVRKREIHRLKTAPPPKK